MNSGKVKLLLKYVANEWMLLPIESKPLGIWITLHCPVENKKDIFIKTPVEKAWFLSNEGIREENIWKYWRFYTVHIQQPWCQKLYGEKDSIFGEPHYIASVKFADVVDTDNIQIETSWAGKLGHGVWAKIEDHCLFIIETLWIS